MIDLKLGTRHYDDDATPEKAARLAARSRASTSFSTGARLSGMQVFKHGSCGSHPERVGKWVGRRLRKEDLPMVARWFLHDGNSFHSKIAEEIIVKLRSLLTHVREQTSVFFYAMSLLIVYDGVTDEFGKTGSQMRLGLIDFSHAVDSKGCPDDGIVLGVESVIAMFEKAMMLTGPVETPGGGEDVDATNAANIEEHGRDCS